MSYFKSYEEVNQGCKGSISLNVCEIVVNDKDITRFDLNVSNEQYIYMRANSEKERQQWLVALGSSKASLANRQQRRRISSTTSITSASNVALIPMTTSNVSPDLIKTKKSELRLYCDLLNQQVHTIKSGATEESLSHVESGYQLLGATCDTFIKTLDELMNLADANLDGYHHHENGVRRVRLFEFEFRSSRFYKYILLVLHPLFVNLVFVQLFNFVRFLHHPWPICPFVSIPFNFVHSVDLCPFCPILSIA